MQLAFFPLQPSGIFIYCALTIFPSPKTALILRVLKLVYAIGVLQIQRRDIPLLTKGSVAQNLSHETCAVDGRVGVHGPHQDLDLRQCPGRLVLASCHQRERTCSLTCQPVSSVFKDNLTDFNQKLHFQAKFQT